MINGENIKNLRKKFGLTQSQLAKAIFVETPAISQYETGKRNMTIDTLEKIANVFGYTVSLNLVKKKDCNRDERFYDKKHISDILKMSKEDRLDYLFLTLNNTELATVCRVPESIIDILDLEQTKHILKESLDFTSDLALYMLLTCSYAPKINSDDLALFVEEWELYLTNIKKQLISENRELDAKKADYILNNACYAHIELQYDKKYGVTFKNINFLNRKKMRLDYFFINNEPGTYTEIHWKDLETENSSFLMNFRGFLNGDIGQNLLFEGPSIIPIRL